MGSAGSRLNFQPGEAGVRRPYAIAEARFLAAGCLGLNHLDSANRLIFSEPSFQHARRFFHLAFDECPIGLLYGPLPKLLCQPGGGFAGSSEQEHPGDYSIEAMDDPQKHVARFLVFGLEIGLYGTVESLLFSGEMSAQT